MSQLVTKFKFNSFYISDGRTVFLETRTGSLSTTTMDCDAQQARIRKMFNGLEKDRSLDEDGEKNVFQRDSEGERDYVQASLYRPD